jgi:hypothetical protein
MRNKFIAALIAAGVLLTAMPVWAELMSPKVGWRADLRRLAHNVSGTVTILDDDTIQVDNFKYDGGGIDVYFYLGAVDTQASFVSGLPIGPQLLGTAYNGSQPPLVIDLPIGETLEGWHAISVWCVTAAVNFGSGSFAPLPGDYNDDGNVDAADYTVWRDGLGATYTPMQYEVWKANFGTGSNGKGGGSNSIGTSLSAASVPEPAPESLLMIAITIVGSVKLTFDRRRQTVVCQPLVA